MASKATIKEIVCTSERHLRELYLLTQWEKIVAKLVTEETTYDDASKLAATAARQGHRVTLHMNHTKKHHTLTIVRKQS